MAHWRAESQAVTTGETRDTIVVKLAGSVHLNPTVSSSDAELFRRLELGEFVTLQIEARVAKRAETQLTDREGEPMGVRVEANLGILTVYLPTR